MTAVLFAAAVLGVRAPMHAVLQLAGVEEPLAAVDGAVETGLVRLAEHDDGTWIEFTHPLTRAAVSDSMPQARRSALHRAAARAATTRRGGAAPSRRGRVRARREPAGGARGRRAGADGARRLGDRGPAPARGDAGSRPIPASASDSRSTPSRRCCTRATVAPRAGSTERMTVADGPRRDSVWAYLAMFAGDLGTAEALLERAWECRGGDDRLAATIAQRRAFLASSRLRGEAAIEWARRATALAPDDAGTALLAAPSLAIGLSLEGRIDEAHAALDRWLDDRSAPPPGSGFILLALKARLLEAHGEHAEAAERFRRSADVSLAEGLLVVAALSLAGLSRTQFLAGAWDDAAVSAERAAAVAIESEDRWVIAHATWSATLVPSARGDWQSAERLEREIAAEPASFERHTALQALAAAQLAAAQERPADVARAAGAARASAGPTTRCCRGSTSTRTPWSTPGAR